MNDKFIIHKNEVPNGFVWHIVYKPGIGLMTIEFDNYDDDTFYLYGLVVAEGERNKGIATELLKKAEEIARENNIKTLKLDVDMNFDMLIPFYEKRGYTVKHKILNNNSDYYYLHKSLDV